MDLTGTSGNDTLIGSTAADRISGVDGTDELRGDAGDDYLVGGEETALDGSDVIHGGLGNDTLIGGAFDDYLSAEEGDDLLEGGTGDDHFYPGIGNNTSHGGDGNDVFTLQQGTDTVHGGAGDDAIRFGGVPGPGQTVLNGGEGNDHFEAMLGSIDAGSAIRITGGAGNDVFALDGNPDFTGTNAHPLTATISDFTQGSDIIRFRFAEAHYFSGNPFGPLGYLRLEQRGADTVIQLDPDGAAGTDGDFYDVLILEGITSTDLDRNSFVGYLDPEESTIGANLTGTDEVDLLQGGPLIDTLLGRGGADTLVGGNGDDTLEGGADNDVLQGDFGNDLLSGGDGDDELIDAGGNDTFLGGLGNDSISSSYSGSGYFDGGAGNDNIQSGSGADTVLGGDGDDFILVGEGGSQSDQEGPALIDGGAGNDGISAISTGNNNIVVTGGSGADRFAAFDMFTAVMEITDFLPGLGGDAINFRAWNRFWGESQIDPFGPAGHVRAVQAGADTVLEFDRDALGTGHGFEPVFLLRGVTATDLTSENFLNAAPGAAPPGLRLTGEGMADVLVGSGSADTIEGKAGNDRLDGRADNDRLDGGDGDDFLIGGRGSDTLTGGAGVDRAVFEGDFVDFNVVPGTVADTRGHGTDTLDGIERLIFDDAQYAFDIDGVGGQAYRLYQAAFNRTPDLAGLGYWIGAGDRGLALVDMSAMFFLSPEFDALYGASQTNEQLVRLFYVNALHREPDEPGVAYWTDLLDRGVATPATILTGFSESDENKAATAVVIGDGFKFDPSFY